MTSYSPGRELLRKERKSTAAPWNGSSDSNKVDYINISTARPYIDDLQKFFPVATVTLTGDAKDREGAAFM